MLQNAAHLANFLTPAFTEFKNSVLNASKGSFAVPSRALTTIDMLFVGIFADMASRAMARRRRLTRFRATAPPTAFDTTKPNRTWLLASSTRTYVTRWSLASFRPSFMVERKSSALISRFSRASKVVRPKALNGPCGDVLPRLRGRHGSSCAHGSRESLRDDGCSAEKYACS